MVKRHTRHQRCAKELSPLPASNPVRYDKSNPYMLRFETAGESHGQCLVATLTGLPAGVPVSVDRVNRELWRRQQGFGRGGRMKIETDQAEIVAGVRHSHTIGAPVAVIVRNKDWENWTETLPVEDFAGSATKKRPVHKPRPGHADLAGCIKYNLPEARYILERASRSEEHTSELQSQSNLVCRLLLEKKKN